MRPSLPLQLTRRAALNKLAIRGIRSFDDKHVQVIEFYSPLTVIVGHNGSGKTVSYPLCAKLTADDHRVLEVCDDGRLAAKHQGRRLCA